MSKLMTRINPEKEWKKVDTLQNLYPECVWNIEEIKQEIQEVKKRLRESFGYLSLRCKTKEGKVLSGKKLLEAENYLTYISIRWEVRKSACKSISEKQVDYLTAFVNFRNRQLEKNLSRKKEMESFLEKLLKSTGLIKAMKKIFRLYVPGIKKNLPEEMTNKDEFIETLFIENITAAVTICLGLNISKKGDRYYYCEDRRGQINENKINIISSRTVWHWSDFSDETKILFNQSGLTLIALHIAEKMKLNEDYVSSIREYQF